MNIEALELAGKVVVVSIADGDTPELLTGMVEQLRAAGAQLVVVAGPDRGLESLDETGMAAVGWVSARRGGSVEAWLKRHRDLAVEAAAPNLDAIWVIDYLLEELRERADYGLGLTVAMPRL